MTIYAVCTWEESGEKLILTLATAQADCERNLQQIAYNFKANGYKFHADNYWIEEIKVTEGIFWKCC